mmetsp:Transcript_30076/g.58764  ORF Transcript_30076/g.58764 Transcript_30076/m.58764 type:complete len:265 (+) Transcript_30076:18-812(+)
MSTPISDDQWDHMLEAWRIFDADCDGLVTAHDLRTVLLSFGYDHSEEELEDFLDQQPICLERDGSLDLPEFILWVKKLSDQLAIEEAQADLQDEKDFEESIPKTNSRRTLEMKEAITNRRMNRGVLEDLLANAELEHDEKLFERLDVDDNGFLTYQDVEELSRQMGELWKFEQIDEMVYIVCEPFRVRRIDLDTFIATLKSQIAWDEQDLLPCHKQLLQDQLEFKISEAERMGVKGAREKMSGKRKNPHANASRPWYMRMCTVM